MDACKKTLELLTRGKRVVVCSSTKTFTIAMHSFIAARRPETRILLYNSSTKEDISDVNTYWKTCDLLIYSPSITAGVSFEQEHFDSLVAFLVNSQFTPSVDMVLQQLFRVRNLTDGEMHLYVHDPGSPDLPHTDEDVSKVLKDDVVLVARQYGATQLSFMANQRLSGGRIVYDTERLSYQILKGIIVMKNRSAMHFGNLLPMTLMSDYGIPVNILYRPINKGKYDADLALLEAAVKSVNAEKLPYEALTELTDTAYYHISINMDNASEEERMSKRLYDFRHAMWGVAVDRDPDGFYNDLVIHKDAMDLYCRSKRMKLCCRYSLRTNRMFYSVKMASIICTQDHNMDLFKSNAKYFYMLLLHGQGLLERVLSLEQQSRAKSLEDIVVDDSAIEAGVASYLEDLGASIAKRDACITEESEESDPSPIDKLEFKNAFLKLMDLRNSESGAICIFRKVMLLAFNIDVTRKSSNTKRKSYRQFKMSSAKLASIEERFNPLYPSLD